MQYSQDYAYLCSPFRRTMIIVNVKENESLEKALKKFKKKYEKTGVLKELRARQAFVKPSVKKRFEVIRARYKQQMQIKGE